MNERRTRAALRPTVRFEVFKRDGFTCQYCGRSTPDVVLEVDHIIPVAEGGDDSIENLITACFDCNRGKAAGTLDSRAPVRDMQEQTDLIREKEAQLRAYNDTRAAQRTRQEQDFIRAWNHWFALWGEEDLYRWHTPWPNVLRDYIERIGVEEVLDAMNITRGRFNRLTADTLRYLNGVLKHKAGDRKWTGS